MSKVKGQTVFQWEFQWYIPSSLENLSMDVYTLLQKKCILISSSSPSDLGSKPRAMSSLSNFLGSNMQKTPFENSLPFSCSTEISEYMSSEKGDN